MKIRRTPSLHPKFSSGLCSCSILKLSDVLLTFKEISSYLLRSKAASQSLQISVRTESLSLICICSILCIVSIKGFFFADKHKKVLFEERFCHKEMLSFLRSCFKSRFNSSRFAVALQAWLVLKWSFPPSRGQTVPAVPGVKKAKQKG